MWFFLVVYYADKIVDPVEKRATGVSCVQKWFGLGLIAVSVLKALTVKVVTQNSEHGM